MFSNFIFHQLLITYNSIINFYPAFFTPFWLSSWWRHTFLQERIQKSSPKSVEKSLCNLGRARPPKSVFPLAQEKNGGGVQKNDEKKWRSSTWNGKLVTCVFAVEHDDVTHSQCAQLCKRHHTHNSVFFLFHFHWPYYNKYFVRYLQIKSLLVITTKYSRI